jgi:hypothetical protein
MNMEGTPRPLIPLLEHYRTVRAQIEHEDNLVSQRLSWLLASQSFLFTAYAITLNGPLQLHYQRFESHVRLLLLLLPLVGIISAGLIWASILAGMAAMRRLSFHFKEYVGGALPAELPPIQTSGATLRAGQLGPVLIPLLFLAVWLVLVLHG